MQSYLFNIIAQQLQEREILQVLFVNDVTLPEIYFIENSLIWTSLVINKQSPYWRNLMSRKIGRWWRKLGYKAKEEKVCELFNILEMTKEL